MNNTYISTSALYGPYLAHHGIKGQKWGVRNGPPYPLDNSDISDRIYNNAKSHISKISSDVKSAAKKSGCELYGLEHQLKTIDSINRKLNKLKIEESLNNSQAASLIRDAIRFTTISSDDDFVDHYNVFKKELENKGYKEVRCKNYFQQFKEGKVKHKAVQSNFKTDDGYTFEVQFHTPASQNVKNRKVSLYEEVRKVNTPNHRRVQIEKQMEQMALEIPDPKDIFSIKSY